MPQEKRFPINPVTHPANNEAECIFSASRSHTVRPGRRCIFPEQGDAVTRNEIHAIPFERNFENPLTVPMHTGYCQQFTHSRSHFQGVVARRPEFLQEPDSGQRGACPFSSVVRLTHKRLFCLKAPKILFGNADAGQELFCQLKFYIVLDPVTI
jgi:hypothetical protein